MSSARARREAYAFILEGLRKARDLTIWTAATPPIPADVAREVERIERVLELTVKALDETIAATK